MNFAWPTVAPPSSSTIAAVIVIPEPISDDDFHDDDAAANDRERVWEIIFLIFTIKCFCYYFFHSTTAFSGPSCRLRIEQLSEIETGWMGWHMIGWYMVCCVDVTKHNGNMGQWTDGSWGSVGPFDQSCQHTMTEVRVRQIDQKPRPKWTATTTSAKDKRLITTMPAETITMAIMKWSN